MRRAIRPGAVVLALVITATTALAQEPQTQRATPSAAVCDSIVGASRQDSIEVGLFVSIARMDGGDLTPAAADIIARVVGSGFVAPRPLRLSVFAGRMRTRILRPLAGDTASELASPTITGVYRLFTTTRGGITEMRVVRTSLVPGFDSAAIVAIRGGAHAIVPPSGEDSMRAEVRFSTDSSAGSTRIVSAIFPRMPVVSAVPLRDNPPPEFPDEEKGDSTVTGEVVFRFVVDRSGVPDMGTVELVRARSLAFIRAALASLPKQMFAPATIRGCPVAQRVEYPFTFAAPRSDRP
jgi:hypothetical protein